MTFQSDVPERIVELLRDCLSVDPGTRPTFSEVVRVLDGVLGGLGGGVDAFDVTETKVSERFNNSHPPPDANVKALPPLHDESPPAVPEKEGMQRLFGSRRRLFILGVVGGVVLVAIVVVVVVLIMRKRDEKNRVLMDSSPIR
ncbi:hypothetical protein HDU67_008276 [Dinochytrium kinnereticum]|nr:hypothetical protein HDU67_008276 [Dinochytrium kinnereticum]